MADFGGRLPRLAGIICVAALSVNGEARAQSTPEQTIAHAVRVCSPTGENGIPDAAAGMSRLPQEERTRLAPFCAVYLEGWKAGFDSVSPTDELSASMDKVCSDFVAAAMKGDGTWLERFIAGAKLDAVTNVILIQRCDAYRNGAKLGMEYARDVMLRR